MEVFLAVTLLSFAVTKCVDTVRNAIDVRDTFPKVIWNLTALGFAILFAFAFNLNVLGEVGFEGSEIVGKFVSALMLMGGGAFGHEFMDMLSARGHKGNPKVPGTPGPT